MHHGVLNGYRADSANKQGDEVRRELLWNLEKAPSPLWESSSRQRTSRHVWDHRWQWQRDHAPVLLISCRRTLQSATPAKMSCTTTCSVMLNLGCCWRCWTALWHCGNMAHTKMTAISTNSSSRLRAPGEAFMTSSCTLVSESLRGVARHQTCPKQAMNGIQPYIQLADSCRTVMACYGAYLQQQKTKLV